MAAGIDILLAHARWASEAAERGDHRQILAVAEAFYERFRGFDCGHWMQSCGCTDAAATSDGFRLSFGDKHLLYRSSGGRWSVSEYAFDAADVCASHELAVESTKAPYSFLEGVAFAFECIENAGKEALDFAQKDLGRVKDEMMAIIDRKFDLKLACNELDRKASRPIFVKRVLNEAAVAGDATLPPPAPTCTVTIDAARTAFKGTSGVYFLWAGNVIEYVGRANCIGSRLSPRHHIARSDHYVSVVAMSAQESWKAEPYYIWKHMPPLNGEMRRGARASVAATKEAAR